MYRIHHLAQSRSHRIVWLAEELDLNYKVIQYSRDERTLCAPPVLQKVHPLGKAPILETPDGKIITESAIIMDYLFDRHNVSRLRPPAGTKQAEAYRYWMHFAEGSLMPLLYARLVLSRATQGPSVPGILRPITRRVVTETNAVYFHPELQRLINYLTDYLNKNPYFAGEYFTGADIQMAYPILTLPKGNAVIEEWLNRIMSRPAQLRAKERGAGLELPVSHEI